MTRRRGVKRRQEGAEKERRKGGEGMEKGQRKQRSRRGAERGGKKGPNAQ